MSCEKRASLIDGKIERIHFKKVDLSTLPKPDPFVGAVKKTVSRLSLVDGFVEKIKVVVLPPIISRSGNVEKEVENE